MNKILLGSIVAMSSFLISLQSANTKQYGDVYAHTSTNTYQKIHIPYTPFLCDDETLSPCAYIELPEGQWVVTDSFSRSKAERWVSLGYLTPVGNGIFILP